MILHSIHLKYPCHGVFVVRRYQHINLQTFEAFSWVVLRFLECVCIQIEAI